MRVRSPWSWQAHAPQPEANLPELVWLHAEDSVSLSVEAMLALEKDREARLRPARPAHSPLS